MLVRFAGLECQLESRQPTKSGRAGGAIARDPDRVGDDDRVGRQLARVIFHRYFEIRRSDFLFELPQNAHVERDVRLARRANSPQRCERRAFVVCRPATEVAIAFFRERERIAVPRLGVTRCRLHVEMVVNRNAGCIGTAAVEAAENDGIAGRFEDRGLAAEIANRLRSQVSAATDVALSLRLGRDRRDLHEFLQSLLESIALAFRECGQRRFLNCHYDSFRPPATPHPPADGG